MNQNRNYLTLFLFVIYGSVMSQTVTTENTTTELKGAQDSLEKVYIYHRLVNEVKDVSVEQAINYNKKALTLANKIKSIEACGITNELMGELYDKNNNIQPAINYYLISAKIYEELNNHNKLSSIYGNLGMLYFNNNFDTERTLFYINKSLDNAVKANDKKLIADSYNRIGGVLFNQNNIDDALYYFTKAHEEYKSSENIKGIAITLNNIGEVYRVKGKTEKAVDYYKQSFELNKKSNFTKLMAITNANMGLIYSQLNESSNAINYYKKSIDLYREINDVEGISEMYIVMAGEYRDLQEIDAAYTSYNNAYNIATKYNKWKQIRDAAHGLSKVLEQKKDYKKSLEFIHIHTQYNDSIIKKQKSDELLNVQSHFLRSIKEKEILIKDSEIALLENEQEINNLKQDILILGGIVLIILTIFIILRLRFRVKKEKLINQKDRQIHEAQQEILKVELEGKDNDLTNFALHLVQKNKVLKQLKTDLNKISGKHDNEFSRKLKELSIHVQQSLQINKDIEEFQHKVDVTYDDFFNKLKIKFPTLTNNEKRLCALLRLDLSTKEIASLNNISVKAIEMSRYRLRKKCDLDNKQSLSEYFKNI